MSFLVRLMVIMALLLVIAFAVYLRMNKRLADETRFSRAMEDFRHFTGEMAVIPRDPWGNLYLRVEATSGTERFVYYYSAGPDGASATMGHDLDDICPGLEVSTWLDRVHPDRVTLPLVWACSTTAFALAFVCERKRSVSEVTAS